jgi:hypothetical protein
VTDAVGSGVGGSAPPAPGLCWGSIVSDDPRCPLLARPGQEVQRAELVHADDDGGLALLRFCLAIGNLIELEHPVLLGLEVGVAALLPGLDHLKGDTLLAEKHAETLVADVVDHPLGDQELGQLGQAPGGEGKVVIHRSGQGDLLDLLAFGQGEGRWPTPGVFGHQ